MICDTCGQPATREVTVHDFSGDFPTLWPRLLCEEHAARVVADLVLLRGEVELHSDQPFAAPVSAIRGEE